MRHYPQPDRYARADGRAALYLGGAIFACVMGLSGLRYGVWNMQVIGSAFILILCVILLVRRTQQTAHPLLNPVLLKNHAFLRVLWIRAALMAAWGSLFYCLPLYLQNVLLLTTTHACLLYTSPSPRD